MRSIPRHAAFWWATAASLLMAACGGGGGTSPTNPPPSKSTPTVTVTLSSSNITVAQALTVTISLSGNPAPTGAVILTGGSYISNSVTLINGGASIAVPAGSLAAGIDALTVSYSPDTASSSTYNSSSGTSSVTVTSGSRTTPTVTVTPSLPSITAMQDLTVTVAVSGGAGNPTPTGTVTLISGSYTSNSAVLSNGGATITVPAGSLTAGSNTLTASFAPDAVSSSTYNSASGTASVTVAALVTYGLTVNSVAPSSGVSISISPADNNGASSGLTSLTRTYNAGTAVTLSAPISFGSYAFVSWTGCTSNPSASICNVILNSNISVIATYNAPSITSITVSPNTAIIGTQVQFAATVTGTGSFSKAVSWSLAAPSGSSLSPGHISPAGIYITPYPAPANVTVTATSTQDTTRSGSVTVSLSQPAAAKGPALTVDMSNQTHVISPYIYGVNGYFLDQTSATTANPGLVRWGGDDTSRYNYKTNTTNSASDYYFENFTGAANMLGGGNFTGLITTDSSIGAETVGTVPVLGWVANSTVGACSFTETSFPGQTSYNGSCGSGVNNNGVSGCTNSSGCDLYGSDTIAAITSTPEAPPDITSASTPAPGAVTSAWANGTWAGGWVNSITSTYGQANPATGAGRGVAIWDLDNEPTWWSAVHRDVHPIPFTYDEVTNGGIGTALAIKTVDPTALVSGPVIDYWWAYFYSMNDIVNGWGTGPCYQPWDAPTDRNSHGGVPMIEYYLQQFNKYSQSYGMRLLDFVDIHTYFAASYNGSGVGLTSAGDTAEQLARMNSTRVFWDPTYTDPNYPQPNYSTDLNFTTSCSPPAQAPQLIRMMKQQWVPNYPGTRTAIDEYNFGGLESINGAVTESDILGIFGREGLDLAALWPTNAYSTQGPGNMAIALYRNYDGNKSTFGDMSLASTSANQNQLAVYGALRTSDGAVTVMVINKTYGDLTATLSLANLASSSTTARAYLYSNANLNAIVAQPSVTITAPASGSTASTITATFPAQSITLLVVP